MNGATVVEPNTGFGGEPQNEQDRTADREGGLRGTRVVETGVDPVTFRFSGGRSAD